MNFTKMQGTGNDFIIINGFKELVNGINWPALSRKLCDRHYGIGADGVILALRSKKADLLMKIYNADGSEAEMCGNGIRCFAFFAWKKKLVTKKSFSVETLAGLMKPEIVEMADNKALVKIDMGQPRFNPKEIPVNLDKQFPIKLAEARLKNKTITFTPVGMGNPHAVVFVEDTDNYPVREIGEEMETNKLFPKRTNVEFIEILSKKEIKMRVWERGSGETLACGTGACASVVAGILLEKLNNLVKVHLLGGDLNIEWHDGKSVFMTGPAETVFDGKIK
ncbi:MAG: diaminopimelate epimerase [Candidatus Margulisbacteria bacterium]|nr:diaminopimelate epimerase [Candidatus Margulisiibacteriota bacterium]